MSSDNQKNIDKKTENKAKMSMKIQQKIQEKLKAAFAPEQLVVINESHLHAGHHHGDDRPFDGTGETHFRVKITAQCFKDLKKLEIHRAINQVLNEELQHGIHALAIEAKAL